MDDLVKSLMVANLFDENIQVLNYLENFSNEKDRILEYLYEKGFTENKTFPLINQSIFISYAYIIFVWLFGILKKQNIGTEVIIKYLEESEIFKKTSKNILLRKNRDTSSALQYLRTIRNSISHGHVHIDHLRNVFVFEDHNEKNDLDAAKIEISMAELGKISHELLYVYNDIVMKIEKAK